MSLCFLVRGYVSRGSQTFLVELLIKRRGVRIFGFFGGSLGKKESGQKFRVGLIPWSTLYSISTFIQIFQKLTLKKISNNLIPKTSMIWKILTSLFNSLLNYKLRRNIWNKIEKSSEIGMYKKSFISLFHVF